MSANTLIKDNRSIFFFFCGQFSFATFHQRRPPALVTLQRWPFTAVERETATGLKTTSFTRRQRSAEGYTPPRPGTASLSRRWCTASSPPPQTAGWCCLSSWRESACKKTQPRMSDAPPDSPDRWHHSLAGYRAAEIHERLMAAHAANDATISSDV